MSNPTPEKRANEGRSAATPEYYPPPPGPPPNQTSAQHPDEQPLPDYTIPTYIPSSPSYAHAPAPVPAAQHGQAFGVTAVHDDHSGHHGSSNGSKPDLADRLSALGAKASSPINMLANKLGSEGFLPASMDKECEKAARILRGFCKDGIYADTEKTQSSTDEAAGKGKQKQKQVSRAIITIPAKVLQRAVGLAVFTTGRVGFHVSGATGSGVLIARQSDGGWSPPSGIQIHSLGAGFVYGADIYDCVLVINTEEALNAFRNTRLSLGTDLAVVAGPWGAGGSLDIAAPKSSSRSSQSRPGSAESGGGGSGGAGLQPTSTTQTSSGSPCKKPSKLRSAASNAVYSYIKSRGVYAGVQVDGTVIVERNQANTAFYGARVPATRILRGEVPAGSWIKSAAVLMDTIRGAEGRAAAGRPPQAEPAPGQWQGQQQQQQQQQGQQQQGQQQQGQQQQGQQQHGQQQQGQSQAQTYPKTSTASQNSETWANAAPATIVMPRAGPLPPQYSAEAESNTEHDLPPAYEEPGHAFPGVGDSKTTH